MCDVLLLSRDERTAFLFRSSWKKAIIQSNLRYSDFYTGVSLLEKFCRIPSILKRSQKVRKTVVFGLVESIVLFPFLRGDVYYVFTGLGRLWINNWSKFIIKFALTIFFRQKNIAVLNEYDRKEIERLGCKHVTRLSGEGHPLLDDFPTKKVLKNEAKNPLTFVYVGRLLKSKGINSILEFLRYTSETGSIINFSCVGDQDFDNRDSISSHDLQIYESKINKLTLLGFSNDPWSNVCANDIFISGSIREGLSFSVLEALHYGLFCVLSDVPGHSDFLCLPGVVPLNENKISQLKVEHEEWIKIPIEKRQVIRYPLVEKYSMGNTLHEKSSFLGLV